MIHLIVGNTGAGKTTYAQALKSKHKAILFSIDTWNKTLFLDDKGENDGLEWFLERIERGEKLMQKLIVQLEETGVDSILDLGFSKEEHREKFRHFAMSHGYTIKLHFLNVPKKVRWERIQRRNDEKGNTFEFEVSKTDFDFMENWFETPKTEEIDLEIQNVKH